MSDVLYTNIFFFVTGIATIVITALLVVLLIKLIKILGVVERIAQNVHDGTELIAEDMQNFRRYITEGSFFSFLFAPFLNALRPKKQIQRKQRSDERKKNELHITDE